jgi:hypothetical protein
MIIETDDDFYKALVSFKMESMKLGGHRRKA